MADGFQPKFVDLVRNTTSTVGTGNFNLGAAATGFTSFTAALQVGDSFYYSAIGVDKPAEREVGRGTLLSGGSISRNPISGTPTNFSSGTKTVALIAAAEWFSQAAAGPSAATRAALASAAPVRSAMLLCESGREGLFAWDGSNQSAGVTADGAQGILVPPASDPTGASGAWVRRYSGAVSVKWFGAAGDGIADDSAAFVKAIAYLKSAATTGYGYGYAGSARLFVPKGVYWLNTTTLDITHGMIIEGESVGLLGPGSSVLKWAANTTGIRLQAYDTVGATDTLAATQSVSVTGDATVRNLTLYGAADAAEGEFHGIQMRATGAIEDVGIFNFQGDGVHILASAGGGSGSEGNANCFHLKRVFAQNCRNGFFIDGADVNAGVVDACNAISNRMWGFWDSSFLGNSYVGCHSAANGWDGALGSIPTACTFAGNRYYVKPGQAAGASTNAPSGTAADNSWWGYIGQGGTYNGIAAWVSGTVFREGGSYKTDDTGNAGNVFVGCYAEGDQNPAQMVSPSLVIGGSLGTVRGVASLIGRGMTLGSTGGLYASGSLEVHGASHQIGPQVGVVTDQVFYYDCTNVSTVLQGRSWLGGTPANTASLGFYFGNGTILDVNNPGWKHRFRINGADVAAIDAAGLSVAGAITSSSSGIGYSIGAGGAVEQGTSRTTGVTLNKICGQVTLVSAPGSTSWQSFTVTNSMVSASDSIRAIQKSGADRYMIHVTNVAAGSFDLTFATTGGTTTEQPVFSFAVVKAVTA